MLSSLQRVPALSKKAKQSQLLSGCYSYNNSELLMKDLAQSSVLTLPAAAASKLNVKRLEKC